MIPVMWRDRIIALEQAVEELKKAAEDARRAKVVVKKARNTGNSEQSVLNPSLEE